MSPLFPARTQRTVPPSPEILPGPLQPPLLSCYKYSCSLGAIHFATPVLDLQVRSQSVQTIHIHTVPTNSQWLSWSHLQKKTPFFPVKFTGLEAVTRIPGRTGTSLGKRNTNVSDQSQGRGVASLKSSSPLPALSCFLQPRACPKARRGRDVLKVWRGGKHTQPPNVRRLFQATLKSHIWAINLDPGWAPASTLQVSTDARPPVGGGDSGSARAQQFVGSPKGAPDEGCRCR